MSQGELADMPNLGAVTVQSLKRAGITSPEQLRRIGAKAAWLRIREQVDPGACFSLLQGLEGAVRGVRWHDLPVETKQELKAFLKEQSQK